MTVADLGFAPILDAIDDADAVPRLASAFAGSGAVGELIGCPSTWGGPRRARLDAALRSVGRHAELVPRAELIAASHADAAAETCAVVETAIVPALDGVWSVQRVARGRGGWRIERSAVLERETGDAGALLSGSDLVVVDGPDPDALDDAVLRLAALAPGRRVCVVDRALLTRHGARGRGGPAV
ncbi:MAG: type VII secretion-associated protein, partial [Gordonia sp. (in: high G+C Gram-positive bacteria)]